MSQKEILLSMMIKDISLNPLLELLPCSLSSKKHKLLVPFHNSIQLAH